MKLNEVFYIFYVHEARDKADKRLVVFYDKETLAPLIAYNLARNNAAPEKYHRLTTSYITRKDWNDKIREYDTLGILQEYGRGIPDAEK